MKKLSFQWRITLMTALLIAAACISLNLLLFRSGSSYIDFIGQYVFELDIDDTDFSSDSEGDIFYLNMTDAQFQQFIERFSDILNETKTGFREKGWLITAAITLLSGVITYFVSGHSLLPLRRFSAQTGSVQLKSLSDVRLDEGTIPEFRSLSRSINQMLERLSEGFEAQRQFVGNAAHELRTPLALMQARVDLYEKDNPDLSLETAETLALIKEQTERLSRTVKTLLDMSELETIPRTDQIALSPMIEEVLTDLMPLVEEKHISITQSGEALTLIGSDVLLYRMLFNLIENAVKYNRQYGRVIISVTREGNTALIHVRDTGPGIPSECRESVFQPFFRVNKSRSRALGGVGLGLSLVWEIVRLHNGTVISVRLPLS